ncbi:hypothetical protein AWZ03_005760 [Drosophila navojoa]|uniref:Trans-1,2-dihydrobenzene-1,2-diol dehydrogenase n=1 Tax=Drosophila navojoa TaxID=7232 RepID=A0A484BG13_DRONA|nr:trans-1,2-dihydrobenzene-1,2-diol dehydrogenase [Drosophila navojoa]TDG47806.1 hypothetical protein AWZ03_005760 [Drosophila navojoa]
MQSQNLNWGIAAAGRITQDFVTALSTIPNSRHAVLAVADVEGSRAQEFAQRNQIPRHYDGFEALSLDKEVDVVYVGTLNPFHYAVVRLMLIRGKHVLCETPLCLGLEQAQELYKLAEQRGVFFMEGMWSRCFPSYERLRELLLGDAIGEVKLVKLQHGFRLANVERVASRALGGSITLDIGIYALQLGQFVFGSAPVKIIPSGTQLNAERVDVQTEFILDYGDNRRLIALITGLEHLENDAIIVGTKGEIKLSNYWCPTQLTLANHAPESWPLPRAKFDFHYTNSCGLRYEAEEVRRCIEKRLLESPKYTHADSLEVIAITDQIRSQIGVNYDNVLGRDA